MKKIQSHPQNTGNEKSIFSNTTNNKILRGEMGTRHQSIRGYEMRRWNRWITETQGFLSLCRYNAVNHYHLSESLLEEVLFQNPFAAIWCSKRQNLSAKHAQEIERLTDGKGQQHKQKRALRWRSRQHRKTASTVKLERLHTFPALINKVCLGLRSALCSSSTAPALRTLAHLVPSPSFPVLTDMP